MYLHLLELLFKHVYMKIYMYILVRERERQRQRERDREKGERERGRERAMVYSCMTIGKGVSIGR